MSKWYYSIIQLVQQFAAIISTPDIYDKVVKAISLIESIIIPKNSGRAKAANILKFKIIPQFDDSQEEKDLLTSYFRQHYEIRDRYLHNYEKRPINKLIFKKLLAFELKFILKLVELNKTMTTVEEVLEYFNVKAN